MSRGSITPLFSKKVGKAVDAAACFIKVANKSLVEDELLETVHCVQAVLESIG
jgi:intracellular sulfur oxidation DsrE/DsrF family protein